MTVEFSNNPYRAFTDALEEHIISIDSETKYRVDVDRVQAGLDKAYQSFMLGMFDGKSITANPL